MIVFPENKWEADEVGDKLSKELFKKCPGKQKKKRNSKLNASAVKNDKTNTKKLVEDEGVTKHENQFEIQSEKKSKRRKRKSTNNDRNSNDAKKIKFSSKDTNKITRKKNSENHLTKTNEKNDDHQTARKNKKKMNSKHNDIKIQNESKLKQKSKNKSSNSCDQITQKTGKNLDLKKIQELLNKKNESEISRVNKAETLRDRMMTQLRASRFRYLNETLYNNQSFESRKMFKEDSDAFKAYHTGYRQQVARWPINPLDIIISAVKKLPKDYIIADFGCGEARLADSVDQKVHSLDLVAVNDKVIACDMAHTRLLTNGIHVVVFCLSLMGSNLSDYLLEANRVLKKDGILKIADIESRFENVDEFVKSLGSYGFKNTWKDLSHNLFYFMDFKKVSDVDRNNKKLPTISLKSCLYKKR